MLSLGVPLRASSSLRTSGNTFSSSSLTTSREGQMTIILIAGAAVPLAEARSLGAVLTTSLPPFLAAIADI